jgi:hypothetical protein
MRAFEEWVLDFFELGLVIAGALGFCLFVIAAMGG